MGNNKKKRFAVPFAGKLCAAALSAVLLFSAFGEDTARLANADTQSAIAQLEAKIAEMEKKNKERQSQLNNLTGNISSNKQAMQLIDQQIDGVNAEISAKAELITLKIQDIDNKSDQISAVSMTISDKENMIALKKQRIVQLEAENKKNLEQFGKLARAMYMTNSSDMMPVLNGSNDWYSYFVYTDVVKNISGQNVDFMVRLQNSIAQQEQLIVNLNQEITDLENDKTNLQQQKTEYEAEKAELEKAKEALQIEADQKLAQLNKLASTNASLQSKVNGLKSDITDSAKEIEKLNSELEQIIRLAQEDSKNVVYSTAYRWPVNAKFQNITCYYGYDGWRGSMHYGIDISSSGIAGTNVYAAQSGTVIKVNNNCTHNYGKSYNQFVYNCGHGGGYGNYVIIDHGGGMSTLYAHCGKVTVKNGQTVTRGDIIGTVGTTGWSTGNHLHFEVRKNGKAVNPFNYKPYSYYY